MKDKALKIVFTGGVDEGGIHQDGFVVGSIAYLFGNEDFIVEFLSLQNRMEIVEKCDQVFESISIRNDDGHLEKTKHR